MKLNIRKFQIGGEFSSLAINYIPTSASTTAGAYAPAVATSSSGSSKSSSSSSSKDELNIKDVLKVFDGVKGLPVDVQYVLKDFKQMFEDDTLFSFSGKPSYSSLVTYYLNNIGKFNALGHSKELYEEARKQLIANNSLDEIAIDRNGRVVVSTGDGLDAVTMDEFKKGDYTALTNRELLDLRQKKLPFGDSIYNTMTGVGMDSVIKKVNDIVHSLGTSEKNISGYTAKQSDAIRSGLTTMKELQGVEASAMTVDGLYKNKAITKDQAQQAKLALQAVYNSLTPQERTLLSIHSQGGSPTETLSSIILSRTSDTIEFEPTLQATLNPDGTKKETTKTEKEPGDENDNPLTQMQEQKGGVHTQLTWITKEGVQAMHTPGTEYPMLNNVKGDMSIKSMLTASGIAGITQGYGGITMGDQVIPYENLKDVMYEDRGGAVAVLPTTTDPQGNKKVDLSVLNDYNEIVNNIPYEQGSAEWARELAKGLKEKGLDQYLEGSDTIDPRRFGLFLMVTGYTTDRWNFRKDSQFIEKVSNPSQDLAKRMSTALSTDKDNKNYEVDVDDWGLGWLFEGGYDDIYRGTVYIPLNPNRNSAVSAFGGQVKHSTGQLYERNYQDLLSGKIDKQKDISSDILNEQ